MELPKTLHLTPLRGTKADKITEIARDRSRLANMKEATQRKVIKKYKGFYNNKKVDDLYDLGVIEYNHNDKSVDTLLEFFDALALIQKSDAELSETHTHGVFIIKKYVATETNPTTDETRPVTLIYSSYVQGQIPLYNLRKIEKLEKANKPVPPYLLKHVITRKARAEEKLKLEKWLTGSYEETFETYEGSTGTFIVNYDEKDSFKLVDKKEYPVTNALSKEIATFASIKHSDYKHSRTVTSMLDSAPSIIKSVVYGTHFHLNGLNMDELPRGYDCGYDLLAYHGYKRNIVEKAFQTFPDYKPTISKYNTKMPFERGVTLQHILEFCKLKKNSCYIVDKDALHNFTPENAIIHYVAPENNKKAIIAVYAHNHVYPVKDAKTRQTITKSLAFVHTNIATRHTTRKAPKHDYTPLTTENMTVPGRYVVFSERELEDYYYYDLLKQHKIPAITMRKGVLTSTTYNGVNVVLNPDYALYHKTEYANSSEHALAHFNQFTQDTTVLSPHIHNHGGKNNRYNELDTNLVTYSLDFNKFYYHCALSLTEPIPSFTTGSYKPYERTDPQLYPRAHVYVKTTDTTLFNGSGVYTQELIHLAQQNDIPFTPITTLVPTQLHSPATIQAPIQKMLKFFDNDLSKAKLAINQFIGMLASTKSVKRTATVFIDDEDNHTFIRNHLMLVKKGYVPHTRYRTVDKIDYIEMFAEKKTKGAMSAGSFYREILCKSYIYMYYQVINATRPNIRLIRLKTDAIVLQQYKQDEQEIDDILANSPSPAKLEPPRDTYTTPPKHLEFDPAHREPELDDQLRRVPFHQWESPELTFDQIQQEVYGHLKDGYSVMIAGLAGTGKSTIANYIRKRAPTSIAVASDWASARAINGKTINTEFKLGLRVADWVKKPTAFRHARDRIVIVDETSKIDNETATGLYAIKQQQGRLLLLGDHEHQILPINQQLVSNQQSIEALVDYIYTLTVPKRASDTIPIALLPPQEAITHLNKLDAPTLTHLVQEMRDKDIKLAITHTNRVRNAINELHNGQNEGHPFLFTRITHTNAPAQPHTYNVYPNMPVRALTNTPSLKKQQYYTVEHVTPTAVKLHGVDEIFTTMENFDLNYAVTCFSTQGMTFDYKYVILPNGLDERALFTAITRATKKDNIFVA